MSALYYQYLSQGGALFSEARLIASQPGGKHDSDTTEPQIRGSSLIIISYNKHINNEDRYLS